MAEQPHPSITVTRTYRFPEDERPTIIHFQYGEYDGTLVTNIPSSIALGEPSDGVRMNRVMSEALGPRINYLKGFEYDHTLSANYVSPIISPRWIFSIGMRIPLIRQAFMQHIRCASMKIETALISRKSGKIHAVSRGIQHFPVDFVDQTALNPNDHTIFRWDYHTLLDRFKEIDIGLYGLAEEIRQGRTVIVGEVITL